MPIFLEWNMHKAKKKITWIKVGSPGMLNDKHDRDGGKSTHTHTHNGSNQIDIILYDNCIENAWQAKTNKEHVKRIKKRQNQMNCIQFHCVLATRYIWNGSKKNAMKTMAIFPWFAYMYVRNVSQLLVKHIVVVTVLNVEVVPELNNWNFHCLLKHCVSTKKNSWLKRIFKKKKSCTHKQYARQTSEI